MPHANLSLSDWTRVQSPRVDDVPIVSTKAKINHVMADGSGAEFGRDSMFQSSRYAYNHLDLSIPDRMSFPRQRTRTVVADADAPPTASVNDIVNEVYEPGTRRVPQVRHSRSLVRLT